MKKYPIQKKYMIALASTFLGLFIFIMVEGDFLEGFMLPKAWWVALIGVTIALGLGLIHIFITQRMLTTMRSERIRLEADFKDQLRVMRHKHRNQLQVLTGYLEMGLVEEGLDYLYRMASVNQGLKLELGVPELELVLFSGLQSAKALQIQYLLELRPISINSAGVKSLCDYADKILEVGFLQMAYVRTHELIDMERGQSLQVTSDMRASQDGWVIKFHFEGLPHGSARVLSNKLSQLADNLQYHEIATDFDILTFGLIVSVMNNERT